MLSFGLAHETVFPGTDIGRLQLFRVRLALHQHFDFAPDKTLRHGHCDLVLLGHGEFAALLFRSVRKLAGHGAGAGAVFLGIRENAEPLEFCLADKIQQRLKLASVSPETHNKGRAQRDAGNAGADFPDQIHDVLLRGFAPHAFQHVPVDVLQRHVHVARDLFAVRNRLNQFIRPMRRMRVEQPNPEIALQRIQLAQQRANRRGIGGQRFGGRGKFLRRRNGAAVIGPQIQAVVSGVLRNQIDLLHAVGDQRPGFGDDVRLLPAAMRAAHPRNNAEAAWMIAALGDLHVGKMPGRKPEARRVKIGNENRSRGDVQDRGASRKSADNFEAEWRRLPSAATTSWFCQTFPCHGWRFPFRVERAVFFQFIQAG